MTDATGTTKAASVNVTREELIAMAQPKRLSVGHRPVHHGRLSEWVIDGLERAGLKVQTERYSLNPSGSNMVAHIAVSNGGALDANDGLYGALAVRNSNSMDFALGFAAGTHVAVCGNLALFSADWLEFRKHTAGLTPAHVRRMVTSAIDQTIPVVKTAIQWHRTLPLVKLTGAQTMCLVYQAIREGIINQSHFTRIDGLLFGVGHTYDPTSLYGFHEAATEYLRDRNMTGDFITRQQKLHKLTDRVLVKLAGPIAN